MCKRSSLIVTGTSIRRITFGSTLSRTTLRRAIDFCFGHGSLRGLRTPSSSTATAHQYDAPGAKAGEPEYRRARLCASISFILQVTIKLYMAAARWPPRSEPQKSHDFLPRAIPRKARSAAIVSQADAAVIDEASKAVPTLQHVVHSLGDIGMLGKR